MLPNLHYLLVTATCLINICMAIRVDWNTNTGPIIPPTPRTTIRPQPPFREPAPVWEDLSNDIPNPNPYVYVLPPPSRPKSRLNTNINYNLSSNKNSYGTLVTPQNAYNFLQQANNSPQVASLAAQYIPNVGTKYVAVIPKSSKSTTSQLNALSQDDKYAYKMQGKYNIKTKKYKAYEKVKYVPNNNYPSEQIEKQQLPAKAKAQEWSDSFKSKDFESMPTKSYVKHVYAKDIKDTSKGASNAKKINVKKS